ncbi:MAG: hypothetical protein WED04_00915 [Promethearchaeati archaeon SRVP18_Atabeyarchaeia-1]
MESSDWSKIAEGLDCRQASLPVNGLDAQSSFALVYHSVATIKARCYKNIGTMGGESSSFSAEAVLSTKSSSGHQLAVKLLLAPDGKLEITVCSDSPEESSDALTNYEKRYKELVGRIGKFDEKNRTKVIKTIEVEMKLDAALGKLLVKAPVGDIYPFIGIVRETLIKTLEGFDPIHIETGDVMASLYDHSQETPLDPDQSRSVSMKVLDWKRRLSRTIDEASPAPPEPVVQG